MRSIRIINKTRDSVLGTRVLVADGWWRRVRGFLGRPQPSGGEGILLTPCRAVHTIGIRFALDVLFLDREGSVVAAYARLEPGKRTAFHMNAEHALEVPAGTIAATGTRTSDHLVWTSVESEPDGATQNGNGQRRRWRRSALEERGYESSR